MREPATTRMRVQPEPPTLRTLKAYAFDPSHGRYLGNRMTVRIDYERLAPGPVGRKIAVLDYDGSNRTFYDPVDLDHPSILIQSGLDPCESDAHFHQQMVYAVTMETIEHFESALGRPVHWRRGRPDAGSGRRGPADPDEDIRVLKIYPHAMPQANAFYDPRAHGILYGYFCASRDAPGRNLPGQKVFTCLSHDIIVHETTHAIIDGIRAHFTEPTNLDVAAFHEAFADLAALFRHFSHREVLLDTIRRTGGQLFWQQVKTDAQPGTGKDDDAVLQAQLPQSNPLVEVARQFGDAIGRNAGLRSALGTKATPDDLRHKVEAHDRGSILVAAVFDAFFSIYLRQTAIHFRVYRSGGGRPGDEVPEPLALVLCSAATRLSETFFRVCVRALDYCPPVDVTFGDFLRALITAHFDLDPEDEDEIRDALMQGFRLRGIVPEGASFLSDDALRWPRTPGETLPPLQDLRFGELGGAPTREEKDFTGNALRAYANDPKNKERLGFDPDPACEVRVPSFHPMFHIEANGRLRVNMIAELVQTRMVPFDPRQPALGSFPLRAAATLIIGSSCPSQPCPIRYVIAKSMRGAEGEARAMRQREFYQRSGLLEGPADDDRRFHIDFALLHGRR
jgi:hypothetical protein